MYLENDPNDLNPEETKEWIESIKYINDTFGIQRAKFILKIINNELNNNDNSNNDYTNTFKNTLEEKFHLEKKIENIIKWNAIIIVLKAIKNDPDIGGHIGTYISASTLYEVGFNHFWKGENCNNGDLIYIQGHSSPGIYARSFLENRLSTQHLNNFRKETKKSGLSSYPHPWLMKNYWQFPTVSMGLGPIQSIYKAKFIHYLINRSLINKKNKEKKIWCMCGDGEMDEPEATSAINLAGRERLNNLVFVINCNLQRLDGPVRGNGKIILELENIFLNAKWSVIKVIWNKQWDNLLKKDTSDILKKRMKDVLDGDYQSYNGLGTDYMKKHFFNTPDLKNIIKNYSDDYIKTLNYGGHDYENIFTAYKHASEEKDKPCVILAKTIKGYGLGKSIEAFNNVHSAKHISNENIIKLKTKLDIPISNSDAINLKFYKPKKNSKEISHLQNLRKKLGGYLPKRRIKSTLKLKISHIDNLSTILKNNTQKISTIMCIVKIISILCKNTHLGKIIIPIVPDEARTFGMESLFKEIKIYSKFGQKYKPVDSNQLIYYNESKSGQLLQEGINEAGAMSSWIAAATSYSTINFQTIPFYMFYSMFGFQRTGDLIWAAADARSKGFLIGAIAGKTALPGEGLQHCDGNSQILASLIPNCVSYDAAFSYELITIIQDGLKNMFAKNKNIFYYITTYNEAHTQPNKKINKFLKTGIIKGIYCYKKYIDQAKVKVELLGSGNILFEVIESAKLLNKDFNIKSNIWSVTSFTELSRNAQKIERIKKLSNVAKEATIKKCFKNSHNPIIAVTDYARIYAEQIREFIHNKYVTLGTDGFGISDSRVNLKNFFEIDKNYITYTALSTLYHNSDQDILKYAQKKYNININKKHPGLI